MRVFRIKRAISLFSSRSSLFPSQTSLLFSFSRPLFRSFLLTKAKCTAQYLAYLRFLYHEATRSILPPPPLNGMLVILPPRIDVAGTHLYTLVGSGVVRVKRHAREQNRMSPAGARSGTARSGGVRTNDEDTAPLHLKGGKR